MPWLIALGAEVALRSVNGRRVLRLEDFYLGYQKKNLRPDELVESLRVPLPRPGLRFRTYKLSKRFDQDISSVCAAFAFSVRDGVIADARIAFGGMAATPKRASHAEAALNGQAWNETSLQTAMQMLTQDYSPLSDMRASGEYRMKAAQNLLRRFWLETRADGALPPQAVNVFTRPVATEA
jgi:xanthine dehydrogenase small subunit